MLQEDGKACERNFSSLTPTMMINRLSKLIHEQMRTKVEGAFLSAYRPFLFQLSRHDGCSQHDLVRLTRLKPPTVSVTLRKMEQDDLVFRKQDASDMRVVHVYLTEKGRALDDCVRTQIAQLDECAICGIDPEELEQLKKTLKKIEQNLMERVSHEEG